MNKETIIQNKIRLAISDIAVTFRANVGSFKRGDRFISSGLPVGFPDLFGFRIADGRFFVMEIKTEKGRLSKAQREFLESIKKFPVISGVVRNEKEARDLLRFEED